MPPQLSAAPKVLTSRSKGGGGTAVAHRGDPLRWIKVPVPLTDLQSSGRAHTCKKKKPGDWERPSSKSVKLPE